jgi:hypothetical protein
MMIVLCREVTTQVLIVFMRTNTFTVILIKVCSFVTR